MKPELSRHETGSLPSVGQDRPDDLDELHHRDRIEEMQADELLRPARCHRKFRNRERRSIRGEDRIFLHDLVELRICLALELRVLDDRFDHDVAVGEVAERNGPLQAAEARVELPLLDGPGKIFVDPSEARVDKLLFHFADDGVVARLRRNLRDAGAHQATAEDADFLDHHGDSF
jgi:hypothetical protein